MITNTNFSKWKVDCLEIREDILESPPTKDQYKQYYIPDILTHAQRKERQDKCIYIYDNI